MKEVIEERIQEEPGDAPLQARKEGLPFVGMERATEIDTAGAAAVVPGRAARSRNVGDVVFGGLIRFSVILFLVVLAGVLFVLAVEAIPSIRNSGLGFLTGIVWNPTENIYGVFPAIFGTIMVGGIALLLASVVGVATAIYLVEYAPLWLREPAGFLIELLAYIPSVVYGLWGLLVMAPWLGTTVQPWLKQNLGWIPFFDGPPVGVGVMAATLILAIMLVPLIVSLSREALLVVPDSQREAMLALGATRWEVIRQAIVPYAHGGIFGAIILSLGRALGETMAVAMTIGGAFRIPKTAMDQGYTLASVIANQFGEAADPIYLSTLMNVGLVLFVVTAIINMGAFFLLRRMSRMQGARA
ncbi:MAG: phosphate ABC transporter permease subunit PstC [Chloroflexota bacterium]